MFAKLKRLLWLILGHFFLVMGIVGPIPFIFLASACYRMGSTRLHLILRSNRFVGNAIRNWEDRRAISLRAKLIAVSSLTISVISAMIFLSDLSLWLKIVICVVALSVAWFICTRTAIK